MYKYIFMRIVSLIPILFVVSIIIFTIIHLTPGDPATFILGAEASAERINQLRSELGFDLPLYQQYLHWIGGVLQGDLGNSYFSKQPVTQAILEHFTPTLSLAFLGMFISLVVSIPLGILAATHRGSFIDTSIMGLTLFGMSVPNFLLGVFLMLIVGVKLGLLPVAGYQPLSSGMWNHLRFLIMPAFALGLAQAALIARMTRSSMLEILNTNLIKTARAKGVKKFNIIYKHALRNAFLPILTVIGQAFGSMVAGAVVAEVIFNIPGIGQLIVNSIARRDYAVIQGVVLFVTFFYVFINLIIDLLYGIIDPRVRID